MENREDKKSRNRRKRKLLPVLMVLVALLWFSGAIGVATRFSVSKLVPKESSKYRLTHVGKGEVPALKMGAELSVSRARLEKSLHEFLGWKAWVLPPGLVPERYAVAGFLMVRVDDGAELVELPFVVRVVPGLAAPSLDVRLPADYVNDALDYDGSFANKQKRRKYFLGHYDQEQWVWFDGGQLESSVAEKDLREPVTFRRIEGYATGRVQFRVSDSFGRKTVSAKIRRMEIRCDLDFRRYTDGVSVTYKITIPKLDANIDNLAPMFEQRPVELLRESLERSMSRQKKLDKMARRRFPSAIPLDMAIRLEILSSEEDSSRDQESVF